MIEGRAVYRSLRQQVGLGLKSSIHTGSTSCNTSTL